MLYTGGFTIEATVNTKLQSQMENLMLNTDDAYFPAGWHEEEVTSISDDDVQVLNEDGTPKTRTGRGRHRVLLPQRAHARRPWSRWTMTATCWPLWAAWAKRPKSLSLNRAYSVAAADRLHHQAHRRLCAGHGVRSGGTGPPCSTTRPVPEAGHDHPGPGLLPQERPDGPFRQAAPRLPQRMAQLAPQLRRQLRRRQRSPAVERPCPLAEHHRDPRGRPCGRKQYLQLPLQHPAADHAGPRPTMWAWRRWSWAAQTEGVTPMALAAAFQIFYDGEYTTRTCTPVCWTGTATSTWKTTPPAIRP